MRPKSRLIRLPTASRRLLRRSAPRELAVRSDPFLRCASEGPGLFINVLGPQSFGAMPVKILKFIRACILLLLVWTRAANARGESPSTATVPASPWPATDVLGRELPLAAEVGLPRADRFVGIFYFLWHNQRGN